MPRGRPAATHHWRILQTDSPLAPPVLYFSSPQCRFLVNVPDGAQRLCLEEKLRLSSPFWGAVVTRLDPLTAGGLIGLTLTVADVAAASGARFDLVGPPRLPYFFGACRGFSRTAHLNFASPDLDGRFPLSAASEDLPVAFRVAPQHVLAASFTPPVPASVARPAPPAFPLCTAAAALASLLAVPLETLTEALHKATSVVVDRSPPTVESSASSSHPPTVPTPPSSPTKILRNKDAEMSPISTTATPTSAAAASAEPGAAPALTAVLHPPTWDAVMTVVFKHRDEAATLDVQKAAALGVRRGLSLGLLKKGQAVQTDEVYAGESKKGGKSLGKNATAAKGQPAMGGASGAAASGDVSACAGGEAGSGGGAATARWVQPSEVLVGGRPGASVCVVDVPTEAHAWVLAASIAMSVAGTTDAQSDGTAPPPVAPVAQVGEMGASTCTSTCTPALIAHPPSPSCVASAARPTCSVDTGDAQPPKALPWAVPAAAAAAVVEASLIVHATPAALLATPGYSVLAAVCGSRASVDVTHIVSEDAGAGAPSSSPPLCSASAALFSPRPLPPHRVPFFRPFGRDVAEPFPTAWVRGTHHRRSALLHAYLTACLPSFFDQCGRRARVAPSTMVRLQGGGEKGLLSLPWECGATDAFPHEGTDGKPFSTPHLHLSARTAGSQGRQRVVFASGQPGMAFCIRQCAIVIVPTGEKLEDGGKSGKGATGGGGGGGGGGGKNVEEKRGQASAAGGVASSSGSGCVVSAPMKRDRASDDADDVGCGATADRGGDVSGDAGRGGLGGEVVVEIMEAAIPTPNAEGSRGAVDGEVSGEKAESGSSDSPSPPQREDSDGGAKVSGEGPVEVLAEGLYMRALVLGTGAAAPSKYRNVSSVMVSAVTLPASVAVPSEGDGAGCTQPPAPLPPSPTVLLLDSGEGTAGQIARFVGTQALAAVSHVFITHIHADHHMGLATLLWVRRAARERYRAMCGVGDGEPSAAPLEPRGAASPSVSHPLLAPSNDCVTVAAPACMLNFFLTSGWFDVVRVDDVPNPPLPVALYRHPTCPPFARPTAAQLMGITPPPIVLRLVRGNVRQKAAVCSRIPLYLPSSTPNSATTVVGIEREAADEGARRELNAEAPVMGECRRSAPTPSLVVKSFAVDHCIEAFGFAVSCESMQSSTEESSIAEVEDQAARSAEEGGGGGEGVRSGARGTEGPRDVPPALVYSGDTTAPCASLVRAARGVGVLVHEATFDDAHAVDAEKKKHSTVGGVMQAAKAAGATAVLLTHFSQRFPKAPPSFGADADDGVHAENAGDEPACKGGEEGGSEGTKAVDGVGTLPRVCAAAVAFDGMHFPVLPREQAVDATKLVGGMEPLLANLDAHLEQGVKEGPG